MKIKKTIIIILLLTFIGKTLGFFRDIFITKYMGFGVETDALLLSLSIVTIVFSTFNTTIRTTFAPMFSTRYFIDKPTVLKDYNNIRNIMIILSTIMFLVIMIFSKEVIFLFAPGINSETLEIAIICLRVLSILLVFYNIYFLTTGFLQAIKIFTTVETANIFNNLLIVLFTYLLFEKIGIYSILIGYIAGSLIQMLYSNFIFIRKVKFKLTYKVNFADESWKNFVKNSKYLLLASLVAQTTAFIDKFSASFLQEGSISALHYSSLVKNLPLTVVVLAITNVLFTSFSISYQKGSITFKEQVSKQIRYLIFLITPFTLLMIVFSEEIIKLLFFRGEFSLKGVNMTSTALQAYSIGMYFWVIKDIYTKVSYAAKDTKTPLKISIISLIINFILNFILGYYYGHVGIALATTIAIFVNSGMIIYILNKKDVITFQIRDSIYFIKMFVIFLVLLFILTIIKPILLYLSSDLLVLTMGGLIILTLCLLMSKYMEINIGDFIKRVK